MLEWSVVGVMWMLLFCSPAFAEASHRQWYSHNRVPRARRSALHSQVSPLPLPARIHHCQSSPPKHRPCQVQVSCPNPLSWEEMIVMVNVICLCCSLAVTRSKDVPPFGPPFADGAMFSRSPEFAHFLLIKGESSSYSRTLRFFSFCFTPCRSMLQPSMQRMLCIALRSSWQWQGERMESTWRN